MEPCNPDITEVIKAAEVNEKSHTNCEEGPTGIVSKKDEPAVRRLDTDDATTPHRDGKHTTIFAVDKKPAGKNAPHANAPKKNDKWMTHNAIHCDGKEGIIHTKCPVAILTAWDCEHDAI